MRRCFPLLLAALMAVAAALSTSPVEAKKKKPVFLYVLDSKNPASQIHGFSMAKTGVLTALAGSPFSLGDGSSTAGGQSGGLIWVPSRKVLVGSGANGASVFKVSKAGVLTPVAGSPFGAGKFFALAAAVRGNQTFLYATASLDGKLFGFSVAADGVMTTLPGFPLTVGSRPAGLSVGGTRLFLSDEVDETVATYLINANGSLTLGPNSPAAVTGRDPFNLNADPNAPFCYFADYAASEVLGFRVAANGTLQATPGSPYPLTFIPDGGMAVGVGTLVYAFGFFPVPGPEVQAFQQLANGSLTPLGAAQDLNGMLSVDNLQFDPSEKFLAAVSTFDQQVRVFSANPANGAVTQTDAKSVALDLASAATFVKP